MKEPAPASTPAETADRLEKAMKEAVEAVERRETEARSDDASEETFAPGELDDAREVEVEVEAEPAARESAPPSGASAAEKVTEALIAAKKELEDVLAQTREETKHFRDKWLRAAADLENYKKRSARERDDVVKFGNEKLLKDLLPVLDDLDHTLAAVDQTGADDAAGPLVEGVKMVHRKFLAQLEKHGVTTFESAGQPFDPMQHEAVQQAHHPEAPAGTVAMEVRRGFFLAGRLLRPALVSVSLGPASTDEAPGSEASDESGE
jgi:molecular chaperone GrpE